MATPIATILPTATALPITEEQAMLFGGLVVGSVMIFFWGFVLWLVVLIDILKSEFNDSTNKIIWLVLTLVLPFLGPLLYLLVGRKQIKKGTGINLKVVFTVISFFIWFPLGTILMWFWTNWPKWVKILITLVAAILVVLPGIASKFL